MSNRTMSDLPQVARAILSVNFYCFVLAVYSELHPGSQLSRGWYLEAFCYALEGAVRGERRRLIVSLPPRHLKSFCLLCLAAWMLGGDPSKKIITVTYGEELSRELSQRFRDIISTRAFAAAFSGLTLSARGDRMIEMRTTAGGYWRTATVGGPLTGIGGDVILIDDLIKGQDVNSPGLRENTERFVEQVLLGRLNNPEEGIVIAAMQRLHVADITARLIETGEYEHILLPARAESLQVFDLYYGRRWEREPGDLLDPERFPQSQLDILAARNRYVFAAQYQQDPDGAGVAMLDMSKVRFVDAAPAREELGCVMQFWDTAVSDQPGASYSVGICTGYDGTRWYLIDLVRGRYRYPRLREMVLEFRHRWQAHEVIIERASSGQPLVDDLRNDGYLKVYGLGVQGDKATRFFAQTGFFESERFAIVRDARWESTLRRDVARFPMSDACDIPDAMSLFANFVNSARGRDDVARIMNGGRRERPSRGERPSRPRPSMWG